MKILLGIFGGLVLVGVVLGIWFNNIVGRPLSDSQESVTLTVAKGDGVKAVADKLYAVGLISTRWHWNVYILVSGKRSNLLAGEYALKKNQSIRQIANLMTTPPEGDQEIEVKLLEGWTAENMADVLERSGVIQRGEFMGAVEQANPQSLLGKTYTWLTDKPSEASLEGFLFPDTYRFFVPSTPAQVVGKFLDNFDQKFSAAMRQSVSNSGRSMFEIIILASIVERELKTDRDRAMAADLFLRRMEVGIPLQSDATVNYVTGKSALRPTIADTQIDSPYNTYKYAGLPPGPIGNPGVSALRAAVNPEPNEYFYFLTGKDGQTHWAKTLEEHGQNRERYL